jgi:hypothetical protein
MTSTPGTLLNYANMLKTRPSPREDLASREASSLASIPLSQNSFEVLSREDAPPEKEPGLHRAIAPSRDPREIARISPHN